MQHRITIDGRERVIDIRAMDEDFILWRKMFTPPLTRQSMETADPAYLAKGRADGRFDVFKEFFRKQIQGIGSCAILAWDGDGLIGKMRFTTKETWDAVRQAGGWICVDNDATAGVLRKFTDDQLSRLLASESRSLYITCFNIGHMDARYQGQGISKAMIEYFKQWARDRAWRRLTAKACSGITPTICLGDHCRRRGQWERQGFRVIEETRIPTKEAQPRLAVIEQLIAGKRGWPKWAERYVRNFERILAANPDWRSEYDRDYLMAYDLSGVPA